MVGMVSATSKIDDFLFVVLSLILGLVTLTIFGFDAFGGLLSFSSVFVSFAFLFGRSAKTVFEGAIFVFLIHVGYILISTIILTN